MIITTMPVLLGGGSLFGEHNHTLAFKLLDTKVYLDEVVQSHYIRRG
jgi:hypothetical protein